MAKSVIKSAGRGRVPVRVDVHEVTGRDQAPADGGADLPAPARDERALAPAAHDGAVRERPRVAGSITIVARPASSRRSPADTVNA